MRRSRRRSLRVQLAIMGAGAILMPIVVLLVVVFATQIESTSSSALLTDDTSQIEVSVEDTDSVGVSVWVPVTALLLALVALVAVWFWAGRAVRPLNQITAIADEIQAGSLDRRIGLKTAQAEVHQLGESFDRMLDRLATASTSQQQLVEDTSHELRTPLAALAVNTEVTLADPNPTLATYRAAAERTEALVQRVQATVDELLLGARSRSLRARQVDNDVIAIVDRVIAQQRAVTPDADIVLRGPESLLLGIDGPMVERALANLVENAVRFTPDGQTVVVELDTTDAGTRLSVLDHGPGIRPEDHERIFDRYYSTSGEGDSKGIGLAIVKQVADAHGSIEVESPLDERGGTRFVMHLDSGLVD